MVKQKADKPSRCSAYTLGVGGTMVVERILLLGSDQWLVIGAMEIEDDNYQQIDLAAKEVDTV